RRVLLRVPAGAAGLRRVRLPAARARQAPAGGARQVVLGARLALPAVVRGRRPDARARHPSAQPDRRRTAVNAAASAPLVELFWPVQGEGRFVGVPRAFVRTATCPIRCSYCDTPHSYTAPARAPVQGQADEPNPVTALRAAELLQGLPAAAHASPPRVSVT